MPQQRSELRMLQMQVIMNQLMGRYKETRSRGMSLTLMAMASLHPRCRLLEDSPDFCTLHDVWEQYALSSEHIADADVPLLLYRRWYKLQAQQLLAEAGGKEGEDGELTALCPDVQLRVCLETFQDLCQVVPETLLRNFAAAIHPDPNISFMFKKQFTTGLGLVGVLSHLLSVGDINPMKVLFSKCTGQLMQLEFKPGYDNHSLCLEHLERVPFRLSRNIETFVGPHGRVGLLPGVMYALVECLHKNDFHVRNLLCLLIRDDLHSMSVARAAVHVAGAVAAVNAASCGGGAEGGGGVGAAIRGGVIGWGRGSDGNGGTTAAGTRSSGFPADVLSKVEFGKGLLGSLAGGATKLKDVIERVGLTCGEGENGCLERTEALLSQMGLLASHQVREKVDGNVRKVVELISRLDEKNPELPVNRNVMRFIDMASGANNLAHMKPAWQPWL
eukprot:GHVS01046001.1.p1 GENE.GHVS01046001.1~~GHVS01046001.1.p1  ORF type:complete len:517 (-),score=69.88 GHVS01046001.1:179-1513(-)